MNRNKVETYKNYWFVYIPFISADAKHSTLEIVGYLMSYKVISENIVSPILPLVFSLILSSYASSAQSIQKKNNFEAITVSSKHPQYWEYKGKELLLLGGSREDNLFQIPHDSLVKELNLLQSVGGNYVRNTMSSRDEAKLWPFLKLKNGKYDLNRWNEKYWKKFESFLTETAKRDIIVQLEVWATFDFYRDPWDKNPFNPKNNINYSAQETKLPTKISSHPTWRENNFFWSIPKAEENKKVLWFQQQYVDKLLSYSLNYGNVLYCMDNETSVTSEWGSFWANYMKKVAQEKGNVVQTTEMWDPWNLSHVLHRETMDHPEIYSFADISQNNHNTGDEQWRNGIKQIKHLKKIDALRPLTNVKIYGNNTGKFTSSQDGIENFVRNIFFGSASARFHRPPAGLGLSNKAQMVIRSIRALTDTMDFFNASPHNELLNSRKPNEAFCRAIPGKEYAIYFTDGGGEVSLNIYGSMDRSWSVQWLNLLKGEWKSRVIVKESNNEIELSSPTKGNWIAFITQQLNSK